MAASFDSYKIFYYVAKYGNITHAASALFLSQSTISRTIQSLEAELRCKLFVRYQHGVELTPEGRTLYQHVAKGCEQIFSGEERLKQMQRTGLEALRIGVTEFTFTHYILPVLEQFGAAHPNVQLEFRTQHELTDDKIFSYLSSGHLDFACSISPVPAHPDFIVERFAEFSDVLVAGSAFKHLSEKPQDISILRHLPVAAYAHSIPAEDISLQDPALAEFSVIPHFRVDSALHFLELTKRGLCVSILPEPAYESMKKAYGLCKIPTTHPLLVRSACIVKSREHSLGAAALALIQMVRDAANADRTTDSFVN